jgi:hypothetical protein
VTGSGRSPKVYRHRPGDVRLLAGESQADAAAAASVSVRTVRRRLRTREFVAELRHLQDESLTAVRRRVAACYRGAIETLKAIADDPAQPAAARVRASEILASRADPAPQRLDLAVSPGRYRRDSEERTPVEVLQEAIERARRRMKPADHVGSPNGERGSGG